MAETLIPTKFKICRWGDISNLANGEVRTIKFGIEAFVPERGWMHCAEGRSFSLFDTEEAATAEIHRLRDLSKKAASQAAALRALAGEG